MKASIGILGAGNMGTAIISGLLANKTATPDLLHASRRTVQKLQEIRDTLAIQVHKNNIDLLRAGLDILIVAVPSREDIVGDVCKEIKAHLNTRVSVISVAATVSLEFLRTNLSEFSVCRAMPNTGVRIGKGVTAIVGTEFPALENAKELFSHLGATIVIEERLLSAFTALAGCGPAFFYTLFDAMTDAGIRAGLSADESRAIVLATAVSASEMSRITTEDFSRLKHEVCSPGGITIEGVAVMERLGVRGSMMEVIHTVFKKMS